MAFPVDLAHRAAPIPTHKALLVLDLQNDFVKPDGACFVRNCPDFLDRVVALAESFRDSAEPVVWVQSVFDGRRRPVINPATGADAIFLRERPTCQDTDGYPASTAVDDEDEIDADDERKKVEEEEEEEADRNCRLRKDSSELDDEEDDDLLDGPAGLLEADSNPTSDEDDDDDDDDDDGNSPMPPPGPLTFSDDPEAFLSVRAADDDDGVNNTDDYDYGNDSKNGLPARKATRCCRPKSVGAQFPAPIVAAIDRERDTVLVKSDYSAFQSPAMLPTMRNGFVTEVYICGALSNISVYATVLDAVSQGLAVTLIEDCLGYRHFGHHVNTMRFMADVMGVDGITSDELVQEQDLEQTERSSRVQQPPPQPAETAPDAGIELDLGVLKVQAKTQPKSPSPSPLPLPSEQQQQPPPPPPQRQPPPRHPAARKVGGSRLEHRKPQVMRPSTPREEHPKKKITMTTPDYSNKPPPSPPTDFISTTTPPSEQSSEWSKQAKNAAQTTLGPGDPIGEGDSRVVYDLSLPPDAFQLLMQEVDWQRMYHMTGPVPRLVAVQGAAQPDGAIPIYRHPADESPRLFPFTPTVDAIRAVVEKILGHPLNHVLIQLYRDGQDSISEHSDKTLDIARDTYICNVSLGAQRTMTLRTKKSAKTSQPPPPPSEPTANSAAYRQSQRVPLPHNSLFVLGETTNMRWLHGIRPDKRPESTKSQEERAFDGQRISLTFRQIATFVNPLDDTIWGQGARSKSHDTTAGQIVHGESAETERLIRAFGQENQATEFDWPAHYGSGFDVVNFVTTAPAKVVFPSQGPDRVEELRVRLCLAENGVRYDIVELDELPSEARASVAAAPAEEGRQKPIFLDPDGVRCVTGSIAILTHVGIHRRSRDTPDPEHPIDGYPRGIRLRASAELLEITRNDDGTSPIEVLAPTVSCFNGILNGKTYIPGTVFGIDDCALFPTVWFLAKRRPEILDKQRYPHLAAYHAKVAGRVCPRNVMAEMGLSV